jgi:hypothetical protein
MVELTRYRREKGLPPLPNTPDTSPLFMAIAALIAR